jgi:hypothetical protein
VIEVTQDNAGTPLSEHFQMRDFLTHDQGAVWPKALVIRPKLVDKLELISQELARRGLPNKLHVMSGFRTPQYNALEVHPGGRARLSRHMYGDASDVFVDADGNGEMDDLNGDGKVTIADARVLFQGRGERGRKPSRADRRTLRLSGHGRARSVRARGYEREARALVNARGRGPGEAPV